MPAEEAPQLSGMDLVRDMRRIHERAHRMSCSDPDDPTKRTLYLDAVDLADAMEAVYEIAVNAGDGYGEDYGEGGARMAQAVIRAINENVDARYGN